MSRTSMRRLLRRGVSVLVALVIAYSALLAATPIVMLQPPDRFGRIMAKVPGSGFHAHSLRADVDRRRDGHIEVGDVVPDFSLRTADRKGHVRLSSFRGQRPVVLVFGSYT